VRPRHRGGDRLIQPQREVGSPEDAAAVAVDCRLEIALAEAIVVVGRSENVASIALPLQQLADDRGAATKEWW